MSESVAALHAFFDTSRSSSKFSGIEGKATIPRRGMTGRVSFSIFSIYLGIISFFLSPGRENDCDYKSAYTYTTSFEFTQFKYLL